MRIQTAVVLLLLVFSVIPLALQGTLGERLVSRTLEERAIDQLESLSDLQEGRLERIVDRHTERFRLIAGRDSLQESMLALEEGENGRHNEQLQSTLLAIGGASTEIRGLHLFASDGTPVASTVPGQPSGRMLEWRNASTDGLRLDLFALNRTGALVSGISGPIVANDTRVGTLVIESDASVLLEITEEHDGLGDTGETIITFRDAHGNARFIAPTRFDPDAAFRRVALVEDADSPSVIGLQTRSDITTHSVDYRGKPVFASVRYIEPLDWALVTKIDQAEALAPAEALRDTLVVISAATVLAAIILGAAAGFLLLARPVQESATYADQVRRGAGADTPTRHVGRATLDEVQALDASVRAMAEGLQATARYRASLLNATSHALRTPLTPLKLQVYQLERHVAAGADADVVALVGKIKANLERLQHNVDAFVDASRIETETGPLQLTTVDLGAVAREAVDDRRARADEQGVILDATATAPAEASIDTRLVRVAIEHVLDVALRNTERNGVVTIATRTSGGHVHVIIEDTGPALTAGMEADAFDAFPTLAAQEKVLGRVTHGLATVRRLVEMHRGDVWIENREDTTGTRVTVALPHAARAPARRRDKRARPMPPS